MSQNRQEPEDDEPESLAELIAATTDESLEDIESESFEIEDPWDAEQEEIDE
ncbi:hypothetical protein [Halorubrum sp. CBA1229]|uniref:hypothetical protein n=1 Tax=Halorubrum sp. CBA1229 TaxID=1853699 RepID=UPI0013153C72|nr:hypothetical protein [Halorubrum sp. CBA1229]QKY18314.1 hypothetical protein Hrr1229_016020 [Halorubrum sp. CBA1229]